jgi:hypothetical protein
MSDEIQSIENLINESQGGEVTEESAQGKFQKKHKEIKTKEIEKITEETAQRTGSSYVNLFGFPISPDALSLVNEEIARKFNAVY